MSDGRETPGGVPSFEEFYRGRLSEHLGIRVLEESRKRVVAEIVVRDDLTTPRGRLAGGVIMAFADILGARGTVLGLKPGSQTTTLESKTNFFAGCRQGRVRAESTPLHTGRSTIVLQTDITRGDGRLAAMVIQTQIVLPAGRADA